jgi:NAD(P)H-dependent FMN reductase
LPLRLHIVIASTRPGRIGPTIAEWFLGVAKGEGGFDPQLVDLAEFGLPVFDEPHHPRLKRYEHEHTKRWSQSVDAGDAFVFVAPEYNHGPTPALLNALNYVYHEWSYKPAGFVGYGGVSGGLRAIQAARLSLISLRMAPIAESVTIPIARDLVQDGMFSASEAHERTALAMLGELRRWTEALRPMRPAA